MIIMCFLNRMGADKTALIVIYSFLTFAFGLGLGVVAPLASFYVNSHFLGKERIKWMGFSSGLYGIGAGIIPLSSSRLIVKSTENANSSFTTAIYFFIAAIILAVVGITTGFFINYRHNRQLTSSQVLDETKLKSHNKHNASI